MSAPNQEPTLDQKLFTDLLDSVGLSFQEVAKFTMEPLQTCEEWREGKRAMPHHIALSLIWLSKHIIQKQKESADKALIILLQPNLAKELVEKSERLLEKVLERIVWWPSKAFTQAEAYVFGRGGVFDLKKAA